VRAIAVNGNVRTPQLPELATMGEQGYPFPAVGWQGIFAPAGTPKDVLQRINAQVNRIQATPEAKAAAERMNTEPPPVWPPERFTAMIENDLAEWKKVVQFAKVSID
jgi:tripartite-type tricarboxylate transporter receptor subunit TctC